MASIRYSAGQYWLLQAFQVASSLSCATGYAIPFCLIARSTLDAFFSKLNSGEWTPTIVSPLSRYVLSHAFRCGSVRMQLMQV